MKPKGMRVLIELEALPCQIPPATRLKRLLKYALRGLDLRCRRIVDLDGQVVDQDESKTEGATK